jgi:hypothetical protein
MKKSSKWIFRKHFKASFKRSKKAALLKNNAATNHHNLKPETYLSLLINSAGSSGMAPFCVQT